MPISKGREGLVNMLVGGAGKLGGGIAKRLFGETGMKVLGAAGMGLVGIYKGFFNTLFGAGNAAVSGISKLGARLFGFDSNNGFGKQAFEGLNTRLDKLIELTTGILNKMGGEAGGGSGGSSGGTTKGTTGTSGEHINPATGEPIVNKPANEPTVYDSGLSGEELNKLHKDVDWRKKKEQGGSGSGGSWLKSLVGGAIGTFLFGGTAASRAAKMARAKKAADVLAKKKDMGLIQRKLLEKRAAFRRRARMFKAQRGKRLANVKNYFKNLTKFKGLPADSKTARALARLRNLGGKAKNLFGNIGTKAKSLFGNVGSKAKSLWGGTKNLFGKGLTKAKSLLGGARNLLGKGKNLIRSIGTKGKNILGGAKNLLSKIPGAGKVASLASKASPVLKTTGRILGKFAGPALAALDSGLAMYNADETLKKAAAEKGIGMSPEERQMRELGMNPHNPDDIEKYKKGRESGEIPNPVGIMTRLGQGAAGAIDAFNVLGWFNDDMKATNMLAAFQAGADENGISLAGAFTGANKDVVKANEERLKAEQKLGKTKAEALNKILARLGAPLKEVYGDKLTPPVLARMYLSYLKSAGIKMDSRNGDYKILSNKEIQNGFAEYCKKQAADKKEGKTGEADKHIQEVASAKAKQEARKQKTAENKKKAAEKAEAVANAPAGDLAGKKHKKGEKLSIFEMIDQFIEEKGHDVCKNMPYTEFKEEVKDYVSDLTEDEDSLSHSQSERIAGMESIFHYARLHGITDKKLSVRMGELIDPRTGLPVERDDAANDKRHAEEAAKRDDEWVSKMAKGQFAAKRKGNSWTPVDVFFKEYIDSVGGLKKAADIDRDTFIKGCAEYVNTQETNGRRGFFDDEDNLPRWKEISGLLYDKITADNKDSSKPGKLSPLKQAASVAFSATLSTAPLAAAAQADIVKEPAPVVQAVTQSELNETKLKTQAELVASKTNAAKPPVDNKPTEKVSKGVDKLNDSMSDLANNMAPLKAAIDKDGMLHIAGMDQLLYITANKPVASGGTQVINNTIVREANEGLDLRRKQW